MSRWGEQERDRMEIFLGSHHFLLIIKHTPPPLIFPASAVLSIRVKQQSYQTECYSGVLDRGREPCFRQTKDVTVPNVPLETCPGSKIVHLIFQGLDICEQKYWGEGGCELCFSVCHGFQLVVRGVSFAFWDYRVALLNSAFRRISMATLDPWIKCPEAG